MDQDRNERSTTMTMIVWSYASGAQALAAARTLEAMGIDGGNLRVLQGTPERDGHTAPTGHFAGPADGPVGTWVNADGRMIREGSFADGDGHRHDAHQERAGSFADVDHDTITSLPHGLSHVGTADRPRLVRLLAQARLEQAAVEQAMAALHHGAALLLAEVPDDQAATVQALLDQGAQRSVEGGAMSGTAEMLGQGSQPQLVQPGGEIQAFGSFSAIGRPGKAAR